MSEHYFEYSPEDEEQIRADEEAAASDYAAWQEFDHERGYYERIATSYPQDEKTREAAAWLDRYVIPRDRTSGLPF